MGPSSAAAGAKRPYSIESVFPRLISAASGLQAAKLESEDTVRTASAIKHSAGGDRETSAMRTESAPGGQGHSRDQRPMGWIVDNTVARSPNTTDNGLPVGSQPGTTVSNRVDLRAMDSLWKHLDPAGFRPGERIFAEGDPGDRLYLIYSGRVKLARRYGDGRDKLVAIAGPADLIGELAVLDRGPRSCSAIAMTDVRAGQLDRNTLRTYIAERPAIAEELLAVLARQLRRTDDELADLVVTSVPRRVARQLLRLALRFGTADGGVVQVRHELTQEEFGQLMGACRPTLNRTLRDFEDRGWIRVENKRVLILDPTALAHQAGTPARSSSKTLSAMSGSGEPRSTRAAG
jgi:CRP/FNR family cyclic AMP-dependent transcriptional regulator